METRNSYRYADIPDYKILDNIFPIISSYRQIVDNEIILHFKTIVRKLNTEDNKYYLIPVSYIKYYFIENFNEKDVNQQLLNFLVRCHGIQASYKIGISNNIGKPTIMLDENNQDEGERLTYHYENYLVFSDRK